ncbi:MAG: hypothetical protein B6U95_02420 [Thermofilum sp. ex4484_82]|nr:MAG: hypothetical protein B6U95_02420 [Thermofilum sp. ex4484_82]OYT39257.1 MAG: hypothetical protein B6U96_02415 [Archaeoglobales archaeon ex4484_92]
MPFKKEAAILLLIFCVLTVINVPRVSSSFEVAYVRGVVYDAETHEPLKDVFIEYYIVRQNDQVHWGWCIDNATTDEKGYYEIRLDQIEKVVGSAKKYTLDEILSNGFLLVAYKEGYLRCYSAIDLFKPQYHYWSPDKNAKVINLYMYKDFPLKHLEKGKIEAVYHFEYQKEAAQQLLDHAEYYLEILKDKLGVELENDQILIRFEMGLKFKGSGYAAFNKEEPCEVVVNWFPWITDPKNENFYLLLVHELIHLFQPRYNSKGVPVDLSSGWIIEGQATAVSKAVMYELGKDGYSFEEQATNPYVLFPKSYEEFQGAVPNAYDVWAKMFSKIVVDYGGEDPWSFIRRFMQILDWFVETEAVGKDWKEEFQLSDYEVILVLSYAACQNLTDFFIQVFNYPADKLNTQRKAYLKYYVANTYLCQLSQTDEVYDEFILHLNKGIKYFIYSHYSEAEKEFDEALELVNWDGSFPNLILMKCLPVNFVIIHFKNLFAENFEKYLILLDGKPVGAGKPIEVSEGKHKIELFYNHAKIYEDYFESTQPNQVVVINIQEYKLKLRLPGDGPIWKITIYMDKVPVETIEAKSKTVEIPLPKGDYKIIVESSGQTWTYEVSLTKDTIVDFGAAREDRGYLIFNVKDQYGSPVAVKVIVDSQEVEVNGMGGVKIPYGEYAITVLWNAVTVYRTTVTVNRSKVIEDITLEFANLKVKTLESDRAPIQKCKISIYWSDKLTASGYTNSNGEAVFSLPKQNYRVEIDCQGEKKTYSVNLRENTFLEYKREKTGYSIDEVLIVGLIGLAVIVLLVMLIVVKRKLR